MLLIARVTLLVVHVAFVAGGALTSHDAHVPSLEVHALHLSGPAYNRVNLVFFGDGYTRTERNKFLLDAHTLAKDLTANHTFAPVLPFLNFFAAFTPSQESGIGVGGKQKDTPFGLYRDGTELRGVYAGNHSVARAACQSLGRRCDYPILLGNDPYYGGLGGEFTITTASRLNGPLVLRHELGHSIIDVGEEYDGGFAYFGANSSPNTTSSGLKWAHWLSSNHSTSSNLTSPKPLRPQRVLSSHHSYPWLILPSERTHNITFSSPGSYASHLIRLSLSGLPRSEDLKVRLDGKDLGWEAREGVGLDRWFYDMKFGRGLEEGEHMLEFEVTGSEEGEDKQLCSVQVLEYGRVPDEFDDTPGVISAFPTFSTDFDPGDHSLHPHHHHQPPSPRSFDLLHPHPHTHPHASHSPLTTAKGDGITYRPTNEACLMRQVTTPDFCSPCLESLWLHLAARVDLIDSLGWEVRLIERGRKLDVKASVRLIPFGVGDEGRRSLGMAPGSPSLSHDEQQRPLFLPPSSDEQEAFHLDSLHTYLPPHRHAYALPPPLYAPSSRSESYDIEWFYAGKELKAWRGLREVEGEVTVARSDASVEGDRKDWGFELRVRLRTGDVRKDESGVLLSRREF